MVRTSRSNSAMPGDFTNATARHGVSLWSHEFGYELRLIIGELMQIVCLDADGCSRFYDLMFRRSLSLV